MNIENLLPHLPVALCEMTLKLEDSDVKVQRIRFLNECMTKISGWREEDLKDPHLWLLENLHPEDRSKLGSSLLGYLKEGKPTNVVCRLKSKDDRYLHLLHVNLEARKEGDGLYRLFVLLQDVSEQEELKQVLSTLEEIPYVGIVIYRDRILYMNEPAIEELGYTKEEVLGKNVDFFVKEEYRQSVREAMMRRLRGESFERTYIELPVITKGGEEKTIFAFAKTIIWKGKPAGLVVFVDITKRKKYEKLFYALKDVNSLIVKSDDVNEMLKGVCRILYSKVGFRMVFSALIEEDRLKPVEICGHDEGFVKELSLKLERDKSLMDSIQRGDISVVDDASQLVSKEAKDMVARDYMSSCLIPVMSKGRAVALLGIYSPTPSTFTQEELELLREIQYDLSFAFDYVEKEKYLKIINTAIEKGHEWVVITDEEGTILYANGAVAEISGYSKEEIIGNTPRLFKSGYHTKEFYERLWKTIKSGQIFQYVFVNRRKNGELFYLDQSIVPVSLGDGSLRFVGIGKDITFEKYLEEELSRIKYVDPITGLLNRNGFITSSEAILEREKERSHALFILDLVNFTAVNQVYGTSFGDKVLAKVAQVLKGRLFKRDVVARLGSDEFAVLARGVDSRNIHTLINKLLEAFSNPLEVEGKNIKVSVNIGAAVYPDDAQSTLELLQKASLAMSFVRKSGENNYGFYNEDINLSVVKFFDVKREIERALQDSRFLLYYQPFYYTTTKKIAGLEALLRMIDEEGNILPPSRFISVLERTELIKEVEEVIIHKVKQFVDEHSLKVPVSVNVSPKSFKDTDFLNLIKETVKEIKAPIILEITERLLIEDKDYTKEFLEEMRKADVKVAVDDFGTGYSSLVYLESLPVDILKIDMQFVHRMLTNPKSLAIVQTIIELGRRLEFETIAEGIETKEQLKVLELLNPTMIQGFLLSKPLPEEEVIKLLL